MLIVLLFQSASRGHSEPWLYPIVKNYRRANWKQDRDRWEQLHATRAAISMVGLSAQIAAALSDEKG